MVIKNHRMNSKHSTRTKFFRPTRVETETEGKGGTKTTFTNRTVVEEGNKVAKVVVVVVAVVAMVAEVVVVGMVGVVGVVVGKNGTKDERTVVVAVGWKWCRPEKGKLP